MAYDNQQAYYQSLVSAGSDPNASAEDKGNAAWAQAQPDYNASYSGGSSPSSSDTSTSSSSSNTSTPSSSSSSSNTSSPASSSSDTSSGDSSNATSIWNWNTDHPLYVGLGSNNNVVNNDGSTNNQSVIPQGLNSSYSQDSNGYWTTNPSNPNATRYDSSGNPMASIGYNGQSFLGTPAQAQQFNALNGNPQAQQNLISQWQAAGQLTSIPTTTPDMSGYNTGGGGGSGGGGGGSSAPSYQANNIAPGLGQQAALGLLNTNYSPQSTNSSQYTQQAAGWKPTYSQGFDASKAYQNSVNGVTSTAANGQPSYSQQLMDSYNKLVNSLDPSSSYWNAYHTTANTLADQIYNTQKSGYDNTINQLQAAKQNDLNVGQNALTDKSFQNYLNTRQAMANRNLAGSGLAADANYRLQLANAQNLQNLYSKADSMYDPRIADTQTKANLLNKDQIAAQQFQNMFNAASKNNATALRNSAQTLGKVMPYDFTSQADQLKNAQAYDKMGNQNNQFLDSEALKQAQGVDANTLKNNNYLDSLAQKYAALNQKAQYDAANLLTGYDKSLLPYQYGKVDTMLNNQEKLKQAYLNNQGKTDVANINGQYKLQNTGMNDQTKLDIADQANQIKTAGLLGYVTKTNADGTTTNVPTLAAQKAAQTYNVDMAKVMGFMPVQNADGTTTNVPTIDAQKLMEQMRHNQSTESITANYHNAMAHVAQQNANTSALNAQTNIEKVKQQAVANQNDVQIKLAQLQDSHFSKQANDVKTQYDIGKTQLDAALRQKEQIIAGYKDPLNGGFKPISDADKANLDSLDSAIQAASKKMDTAYSALDFLQQSDSQNPSGGNYNDLSITSADPLADSGD